LDRLGFVERRPDPRDGRARIVVPTEAGREGIAAAAGLLAETEADLAERLGKEKLDSLVALLEDLSILLAQAKSSSGYRK
jgi:DNA-binding MarR family transcriptional regulator